MSRENPNRKRAAGRIVLALMGATILSACDEGQMPAFLQPKDKVVSEDGEIVSRAARSVERDIEAPDVFEAREAGLWDGRPSLGGVWVAHPDVTDPERVIIRNEKNGKFVIGALFRRERMTPGPKLQVSSDAAAAVGMLAGEPNPLHVVALRREEVAPDPDPVPSAAPLPSEAAAEMPAAPEVTEGTLDPVAASAAAVIEGAPIAKPTAKPAIAPAKTQLAAATTTAPAPTPKPKPKPKPVQSSKLSKPYIQIGIFSIEQNAKNTATAMRQDGMVPTVLEQSSKGKTFWRVVVGPAQDAAEQAALLKKIKASGFTDAYAVTN